MSANASSSAPANFTDTSTDCAICLYPLAASPTLTLTCGHIYHLSCLHQQLTTLPPTPSRRLLLSGCRCAQCQTICTHPALTPLTTPYHAVLPKVDALIREQLRADNISLPEPAALAYGRRTYAFYLCVLCGDPYFGGTVRCADVADDAELAPDDRLCGTCTPRTSRKCRHARHAPFHVWKCRYCCARARYVCFGSTHFCAACHPRDDARTGEGRTPQPVECPGAGVCETPMPDGEARHRNGAGGDCELLLECTMCESGEAEEEERGANMVYNASGRQGMDGWESMDGRWRVEHGASGEGSVNFVSGCSWCVMGQAVDLRRFVREPGQVRVEVSARYMGRWDCPSTFRLTAGLYDEEGRQVAREQSEMLAAPAECWEEFRVVFAAREGVKYVTIVVAGKDDRFWAGDYGAKVSECAVRVLGGAEERGEMGPEEVAAAEVEGRDELNRRLFRTQEGPRREGRRLRFRVNDGEIDWRFGGSGLRRGW